MCACVVRRGKRTSRRRKVAHARANCKIVPNAAPNHSRQKDAKYTRANDNSVDGIVTSCSKKTTNVKPAIAKNGNRMFDKRPSPKGGYGLFANQDTPAHTVVAKLKHNRNDGVVIEQNCMCWGCWELEHDKLHDEMRTHMHSVTVLREVLHAVLSLIRPGSCAVLVEATQSALKANICNISEITSDVLCTVVRKLCRTFCCKECDNKFKPHECYTLRNAWTLFSDSTGGFKMIFKTMDRILRLDGDNVTWDLDPAYESNHVRLINEPNQEKEANAVFVDRLHAKQKCDSVKRHEVVVILTKPVSAGEEIYASYGDGVVRDYDAIVDKRDVLMCDNFYVIIEPNGAYDIHEIANGSCINEQTQNTAKRRLVRYANTQIEAKAKLNTVIE